MRASNLRTAFLVIGICGLAAIARADQDDLWPDSQPAPTQQKPMSMRMGDASRSAFGGQPANGGARQRVAGAVRDDVSPDAMEAQQVPTPAGAGRRGATSATTAPDSWARYQGGSQVVPGGRVAVASADMPVSGGQAAPADAPSLHERMEGFRRSSFADTPARPTRAVVTPASSKPAAVSVDTPAAPAVPDAGPTPTLAPPKPVVAVARRLQPVAARSSLPPAPAVVEGDKGLVDAGAKSAPQPMAQTKPKPTAPAAPAADSNVLFARQSPVLSVETKGPRRISVGKEATYQVTVQNNGEVAAEEVAVFVAVPEWTDVSGADATMGTTRTASRDAAAAPLQWNVGRLEAKSQQTLRLRLVPRQSRPFDLAVRWDFKPGASQAMIDVQEPKLVLHLDGPAEVIYGKKEMFKLKLSNTGSGAAENVAITLVPVGASENRPVSHSVAVLAAGEQRVLEIELTARDAGNLTIQVEAKADGGAHVSLAEKLLVRRAGLQLAAAGPAVQYVGTPATYRLALRNPGNAPAKNVKVLVNIPPGAKYVSSSDGGAVAVTGTQVQWALDSLEAGADRALVVKYQLGMPGTLLLDVHGSADDELTAAAQATTNVEAVADVRLEVKEPEGPVPVGEDAAYELHVKNRGTKGAQAIEVYGYFSQGIEPTSADGATYRLSPGQVTFSPIPTLAAGQEVTLKVHSRAATAGNHVFRAEVHCKALGTRLVSEQNTRFYQDGPVAEQAARGQPGMAPGSSGASYPRR